MNMMMRGTDNSSSMERLPSHSIMMCTYLATVDDFMAVVHIIVASSSSMVVVVAPHSPTLLMTETRCPLHNMPCRQVEGASWCGKGVLAAVRFSIESPVMPLSEQ